MSNQKLNAIREERIAKLKKLRGLGIDPYPAKSRKNIANQEIIDKFAEWEGKEVVAAGRLMSWREHGNIAFGHIQDESGRLQLYIKKDELNKTNKAKQTIGFAHFPLIDVGDFLEAAGIVTKTKKGEISVLVKELRLLTKTLRPLPDKWAGLKDKELRLRKRYLDFVMNPERKEIFQRKSKFWQASREFLQQKGFLEVETPVLEYSTGGADAAPFSTYHNDLGVNLYLRISTELSQKRLMGAGFEKIYTLGPNFRNEGGSDEHLQEYYQMEWYWAYADFRDNMKLAADFFRCLAQNVYGKTKFKTRGHGFDLADKWEEIDYAEIIKKKLGIDIFSAQEEKMLKVIKKQGVQIDGAINRNRLVDNLWKIVRKTIAGPAWLVNEPAFLSPLAKNKPNEPRLVERCHAIIAGSELGNGYSELNDPLDQLERFRQQQQAREQGDKEAQMMDYDYVEMLEYGMPPCSGWGHSERLFWFLEDLPAREGILFPLMKPEEE